MTKIETGFGIEQEKPPAFDGIVVLGRGIEQVDVGETKKWKPTRAIEELSLKKGHPGIRVKEITPEDENESVVVAGANANVLAAVELFEELKGSDNQPGLVIFAAGRPDFLKNESDETLSEGKILVEKFARL